MAALGVAGLFLVLARGPVDLAFLSDRIAVGLEQQMGAGIDVEVGRTVLEKNDEGFALHVLDIVLKEASGREILRSPDAVVAFNPLHLLRLSFVPERLSLRGMKLRAEITAEGDVLFTSTGSTASATTRLSDVVAAVLGVGAPNAAGGWSAIAIADASLDIDDRRNGKRLSFDHMNLAFGSPRKACWKRRDRFARSATSSASRCCRKKRKADGAFASASPMSATMSSRRSWAPRRPISTSPRGSARRPICRSARTAR